MSDTIQALNEVIFKCSLRFGGTPFDDDNKWGDCEDERDGMFQLLEDIVEIAGDAVEDHVKASERVKPRKTRVYKEIVEKIAGLLKNDPVATGDKVEQIQSLLVQYGEE